MSNKINLFEEEKKNDYSDVIAAGASNNKLQMRINSLEKEVKLMKKELMSLKNEVSHLKIIITIMKKK